MDSAQDLPCGRGCPIRRPADQRVLAPPRSFSQRATSFIASRCQGIHQMPLPKRLIAKPVARRDKPRSQQVSHEDALLALEQPEPLASRDNRPRPRQPMLSSHSPGRAHGRHRRSSRSPRYSLFTLSKIKNLAASAYARSKHCVFSRSSTERRSASFMSGGVAVALATAIAAPCKKNTGLPAPGRSRRNSRCACRGSTRTTHAASFGRWWR